MSRMTVLNPLRLLRSHPPQIRRGILGPMRSRKTTLLIQRVFRRWKMWYVSTCHAELSTEVHQTCDRCISNNKTDCYPCWSLDDEGKVIRCYNCRRSNAACSFVGKDWGVVEWPTIRKFRDGEDEIPDASQKSTRKNSKSKGKRSAHSSRELRII